MTIDLSSIGEVLRKRRDELGLSIENVAGKLNLRKVMVDSIERGDEKFLPHEVYVKGYIKEYARLLGIESDILPLLVVAPVPVAVSETPEEVRKETVSSRFISKLARTRIPSPVIVYSAVVIVILIIFFLVGTREERQVQGPGIENVHHLSAPSKEQEKISVTDKIQKKLVITCHERTWISVVIDGMEKKEFMLSPEEIIVLNGKDHFELLVGNAGGVKVFLNGKDTGFSGNTREVKRISLS